MSELYKYLGKERSLDQCKSPEIGISLVYLSNISHFDQKEVDEKTHPRVETLCFQHKKDVI